jgi:hypothetical protein
VIDNSGKIASDGGLGGPSLQEAGFDAPITV